MELFCAKCLAERWWQTVYSISYAVALKTQIIIDCMLKSARSSGISVNVNDISDQLSFARSPIGCDEFKLYASDKRLIDQL